MSGYERPTDKGTSKETVTFRAHLWRAMDSSIHGEVLRSPMCATQPELVGWVRQNRRDGDQVWMWKRVSRASGYEDTPLSTEPEPPVDKARLHALVEELKSDIDRKKRELDRAPLKAKAPA